MVSLGIWAPVETRMRLLAPVTVIVAPLWEAAVLRSNAKSGPYVLPEMIELSSVIVALVRVKTATPGAKYDWGEAWFSPRPATLYATVVPSRASAIFE